MYLIIENASIDCPFCRAAKQMMIDRNLKYCTISITSLDQKIKLKKILSKRFAIEKFNLDSDNPEHQSRLTVPQIFKLNTTTVICNLYELDAVLQDHKCEVQYIGGSEQLMIHLDHNRD